MIQEAEVGDVVGLTCDQLSQVVNILHNLVRSADIPSKGRSQDLFKCLQKFYSVLEQLTKHVCVCIHVCLCMCMCGYVYMCVYMYVCACLRVCVFVCNIVGRG